VKARADDLHEPPMRIAAIDIGSNSTHLIVAEVDRLGHVHVLESRKEQTRLAAELIPQGQLSAASISRLCGVLRHMKEIADGFGAEVRAVGTYALRQAQNGAAACRTIERRTGVHVEIISGIEEARLIALGVQLGMHLPAEPVLILDIGGGSTEIFLGRYREKVLSASLDLGCVHLTGTSFPGSVYREKQIEKMETQVLMGLINVSYEIEAHAPKAWICSSGTAKAVKEVALSIRGVRVPSDLHGESLSLKEIRSVYACLRAARTPSQRRLVPMIDQKRVDILLAGCAILLEFSEQNKVKKWIVSEYSLREGLVVDFVERSRVWVKGAVRDVRQRGVQAFARRVQVDEAQSRRVADLSIAILDELSRFESTPVAWREYLRAAAFLHEAGRFLRFSGYHKHSYYLIRNAILTGFTLTEQEVLALVVRFHRKKSAASLRPGDFDLGAEELRAVRMCSTALRMAVALCYARKDKILSVRIRRRLQILTFTITGLPGQDLTLERLRLDQEIPALEEVLRAKIKVLSMK
jgi:exopolyphosphatase/guanosine-5'-triphosphate,3'-diphosphate pyrophosphatase